MAKYEHVITLTPRERPDDTDNATDEPTLREMQDAIQTGVAAVYGDDFMVDVSDGNRPDID